MILSDIHANLAALETVGENFDRMVFLGDLVGYGPRPGECIEWVRQRMWKGVRGNHDEALANEVDCRSSPRMHTLSVATRAWHSKLVDGAGRTFLKALPLTDSFEFGGSRFRVVHGSPTNPLYSYLDPDTPDEFWKHELMGMDADVLLYGHTHLPLLRTVGRTLLLNPGSIGQPRSGRPETSYAVWDDGDVSIRWVRYDVARTVEDLERSPLDRRYVGPLVQVLVTGNPPANPPLTPEAEDRKRRRCPMCNAPQLEKGPVEKIIVGGPYRALLHLRGTQCRNCAYDAYGPDMERFIERVRNRLYDGDVLDLRLIGVNFYEVFAPPEVSGYGVEGPPRP